MLERTLAGRTNQLAEVHNSLELILDALRVDGDHSVENSEVISAVRNGDSYDRVLAIARRVSKRRKKRI
jgi:hypothetical protein